MSDTKIAAVLVAAANEAVLPEQFRRPGELVAELTARRPRAAESVRVQGSRRLWLQVGALAAAITLAATAGTWRPAAPKPAEPSPARLPLALQQDEPNKDCYERSKQRQGGSVEISVCPEEQLREGSPQFESPAELPEVPEAVRQESTLDLAETLQQYPFLAPPAMPGWELNQEKAYRPLTWDRSSSSWDIMDHVVQYVQGYVLLNGGTVSVLQEIEPTGNRLVLPAETQEVTINGRPAYLETEADRAVLRMLIRLQEPSGYSLVIHVLGNGAVPGEGLVDFTEQLTKELKNAQPPEPEGPGWLLERHLAAERLTSGEPAISEAAARAAVSQFWQTRPTYGARLVEWQYKGRPVAVWVVEVRDSNDDRLGQVFVDAVSGQVMGAVSDALVLD